MVSILFRIALVAILVVVSPTEASAQEAGDHVTGTQPHGTNAVVPKDLDILYARATRALDADQAPLARDLLEEIVAKRPEFAGAWLDLALATYRSGDIEGGLEHLDYVRSHFVLPPVLSRQVEYWQKNWQQQGRPIHRNNKWQGELTLGIGHDTNVNAGLNRQSLAITLPGGDIDFPLDPASRPVSDNFALLGLTTWGSPHPLGQGSVTPVVLLRGKRMQEQSDYTSLDLQAGAVYLHPAESLGSWRLGGFVQRNHLGGRTLSHALRLEVQRVYPWSTCQLAVGGELETRYAKDETELEGELYSLTGSTSCPLPGDASLNSLLRIGHTRPRAAWPGGEKNGLELALQYSQPMGNGRRVDLTWRASWLNDREGYSPLLENNAARKIVRQNLSVSLRQTIAAELDAVLSVDLLKQHSNLELFRYDARQVMLSLVRRF